MACDNCDSLAESGFIETQSQLMVLSLRRFQSRSIPRETAPAPFAMNHFPDSSPSAPIPPAGGAAPSQLGVKLPKIIRFSELAVCGEEVWIDNNGELYRLRRTRSGKLILTK